MSIRLLLPYFYLFSTNKTARKCNLIKLFSLKICQILNKNIKKYQSLFFCFILIIFSAMDKETLREIIFESKQFHKQRLSVKKKLEIGQRRIQESARKGSICLLGSFELQQKHVSPEPPFTSKFQIVQLKKNKSLQTKKQDSIHKFSLKPQSNVREIRSQRDQFKIDKVQLSQLGAFQKTLNIKITQKHSYLIDGQFIKNSKRRDQSGKVSQRTGNNSNRKSSFNIELLPSKFVPSQVVSLKEKVREQKSIWENDKWKVIDPRRESWKKSLFLDFQSVNFNLSEVKWQSNNSIPKETQNQKQQQTEQQEINRAASVTLNNIPRKNYLKKVYEQQKQLNDKLQLQKKQVLEIRKEVNKNYSKPFNPPQNISAQAYIVYEITKKQSRYRKLLEANYEKRRFLNSHKILAELNSRTPVEIASLTKIMTFVVALEICKKYSKNPSNQIVKIGIFEQNITGTTANLVKGEIYTLEQLFYGLMLPSGNDASLAISVWGGRVIVESSEGPIVEAQSCMIKKKRIFFDRFLVQMNNKAAHIGMEKTHYANPHGLMNFQNKSCAFDLALLCQYAMKKEIFRQVVNTRIYQCTIQSELQDFSTLSSPTFSYCSTSPNLDPECIDEIKDFYAVQNYQNPAQLAKQMDLQNLEPLENQILSPMINAQNQAAKLFQKNVVWENTHFLVQQKSSLYKGIKTGITNSAGPCLASMVEHNQRQFLLIVLNCRSMKQRFRDTENLRKWAFQKEQIKFRQ